VIDAIASAFAISEQIWAKTFISISRSKCRSKYMDKLWWINSGG
jgi:hypothetical protein